LALTGKQKAAMLLMSLDAATAAELIKGLDDKVVRELAVELAYLDATYIKSNDNSNKVVRQFHHSLRAGEKFKLNGFLDEILKSTVGREKAAQIQARIERIVCNPVPSLNESPLREIAVIVRDLGVEIRDGLLNAIFGEDRLAIETVAELMIVWADIPNITDSSLQKVLKGIDSNKLALALHQADEAIIHKIRSNLSVPAIAALDRQASLISTAKDAHIHDARNRIVRIMREVNDEGELVFMNDGYEE